MEDSLLIDQAQKDPQAFEQLYEKYAEKVYKYFFFHTNLDYDVAEDLTQETFVRAYDHLPQYEDKGYSYGTYLLTIAHNMLVNHYRKKQPAPIEEATKIPYNITEELEHKSEEDALHKAIETLPPQEQKIIELKYAQDLPIRDIAAKLHKNENTIKLALFRIRKKLKGTKYLWA
jgi:RNA polymerase sigma-70 factor, ECF subfamily